MDEDKTKEELIKELVILRQKLASMGALESEYLYFCTFVLKNMSKSSILGSQN